MRKKIWLYCQNAFLKYEINLHSSERCDKTGFVIPNFHSSFPGQDLDKTLFHVLHRIECVSEAVVDKHNAQCWHILGLAAMWTESQPRLASGQNKAWRKTKYTIQHISKLLRKPRETKGAMCWPSPRNTHFSTAEDQNILFSILIYISSKMDIRILMFYKTAYLDQNRRFSIQNMPKRAMLNLLTSTDSKYSR